MNAPPEPVANSVHSLIAHLRMLAATRPGDAALVVATTETETTLSYAELELRVRAVAAQLQTQFQPGDRALLLLNNDEHYVVGFLACLYAGLIAVPAFPPESQREQQVRRLAAIALDAQAHCVLVTSDVLMRMAGAADFLRNIETIIVDGIPRAAADRWQGRPHDDREIVFLQYTSGSTATPKGVVVDHGNLLANQRAIQQALQTGASDVLVSWLPLFHDMGLVGGLFQPIYSGIPLVLMSPADLIERPVRWLELITQHGGTISGGPDFAYRLCVERVTDTQLKGLDLSSWRVAFSGAEPVRYDTLHAFAKRFAPAGFDAGAIYPCYGLAEATLFVTGGHRGAGMLVKTFSSDRLAAGLAVTSRRGTTLVACGTTHGQHRVRIVNPHTGEKLANARIGEIWVRGPSVSRGYWCRERETAETFVERDGKQWLRTGDLGFVRHKQLYIAGRQKDLIILRGQNFYPQDIEQAVESRIEVVRKGRVAAFAVQTQHGDGIGLAVEVSRGLQKVVSADRLVDELGAVVSALCHEPLTIALLLNPGALPKTSSGKLQRSACRQGWQQRTLDAYAIHEHGAFVLDGDVPQGSNEALQDDVECALAEIWREVLKCAAVARDANLFASGGNSLSVAQVAARIGNRWGLEFPLRKVFEKPGFSDLAEEIRTLLRDGQSRSNSAIAALPVTERARPLPLSSAQRRLWFLWRMNPANTAYHISGRLHFSGHLDVAALSQSVQAVVARHESLRTVFRADDHAEVRQTVLPVLAAEITVLDLRSAPHESWTDLQREQRRIQETPFDLGAGPLFRVGVFQTGHDQWQLVLAIHHIVADGWSMQLLLDELAQRYEARMEGRAVSMEPLTVQYVDYAAWQQRWLDQGAGELQLKWWRERLGQEHPVLELPADHPRRQVAVHRPGRHESRLPQALVVVLRHRAEEQETTLFAVLLAAFKTLLHRYTNQRDVRVGVPVANRHHMAIEGVIGFFVNTLVLNSEIDGHDSLNEVLRQVAATVRQTQAQQDLPFEQLVEALQPDRDLNQSPLFRVVMNHLRVDERRLKRMPNLRLDDYWIGKQAAQFELALDTVESADAGVIARFTYAAELFEEDTIARFAEHYVRVLEHFAWQPERLVRDVELLSAQEHGRLLEWSENRSSVPAWRPVHRLVEQQAATEPGAVAVVCDDRAMSYAELNAHANRLAHRLMSMGVAADMRVGIAMERSSDMVVALLGVMKAGAAYVPLDPEGPAERLRYMVQDSGVKLLLTQRSLYSSLSSVAGPGVGVLVPDPDTLIAERTHDPTVPLHEEDLVYLIYTSGSSGKPKAVANSHGALHNRLAWGQQFDPLRPGDAVLQKTPFTFDISFWEFFWPLSTGATLVMAEPGAHRDPQRLIEQVQRHRVTTIHFVPSMLQAFLASEGVESCSTLRRMICSGEALPLEAQSKVADKLPDVKLYNFYGPTEAAVEVTYWTCENDGRSSVPIGRPIAGARAVILDANLQVAPQGVVGELYLGGKPVARGYPTRPGLTAERFVADPHTADGARLYRTGDLARWRADGQIEYLGRVDHQVKIRGHRIELGEIEAELLTQPQVREAVVVARDGEGGKRLVAYVVPTDTALEAVETDGNASQAVLVNQWESVFESAYGGETAAPDFRGWNSSYTDQPIPEAEMQEWLRATVDRIGALAPRAILEIGCGVGLLVQHLAPRVPVYRATDFSARAVKNLRSWTETQPSLAHVDIRHADAADFSSIDGGRFDTIVLNSVVQYFPGVDYLMDVLQSVARNVAPAGRIFVGDVRHLAHLTTFHGSVQLAKAPAALTVRQLKGRIRRAIAQDQELVLDPAFFHAVAPHLRMAGVEILLRRGRADNELTRYRYDAVLRARAAARPDSEDLDWLMCGMHGLARRLIDGRPRRVSLSNVPNLRIARDVAAWRCIEASDDGTTVAEVRAQLKDTTLVGMDPEELWVLGEQYGYAVAIAWSPGSADGAMDVEFMERAGAQLDLPAVTVSAELPPRWRSLASDPLRSVRVQQLQKKLRDQLGRTLPAHMVPSAVVALESLPLNANGKLDRKALPDPEYGGATRYEAPQGEMEAAIAAIWREVLGVERVGRNDNFFELGGHSLAAMRVAAYLQSRHGASLPVRAVFEAPTLAALVQEGLPDRQGSSRRQTDLAAIDALLAIAEE